ncbi:MAG: UvrD-helicase domain-containing protein, partial [bacterium]
MIKVLINEAFKKYLLQQPPAFRQKVQQKFEFLEIGYWDGGLQVKKMKSIGGDKAIFEARLDKANRILFTLGAENDHDQASSDLMVYVWGIVCHDDVTNKSRNILPDNVPFLQFKDFREEALDDVQLDTLQDEYFTQEGITQKTDDDSATQKWHFLDDENWQRISQYRQAEFELRLYLTPEQQAVLDKHLPVLISGTAGSGKTTISVYELLHLPLAKKKKLFITYNHYLKNTAQQLYDGLLNESLLKNEFLQPDFFAFKEFCLKVANTWHREFPHEKEVTFERFNKLIRKNSHAKRFDAPLIWEEIRSIIKGALPQINVEVLKKAHAGLKSRALPPVLLNALQQQFLTFAQLKSLEKIEKFTQKYLHTGLATFAKNLGHFVESDSDRVLSAIERVIDLLHKERELTQKKYLSFPDYEALGKKKAPNFQLDRKSIYRLFEWYQGELENQGLWDELDLTREAINLLNQHDSDAHRYDIVVCDEVQDLTDVQHELLFYVVRHPVNLLLCGDTKQIINPSGFRWEELKRHFYARNLPIPKIFYLNLNFRSSGSIVELSNILLDLKASLLGSRAEEQKEEWKYKGRPPVVVQNLNPPTMLDNIRRTGVRKTILVRTEEEKNALQKLLDTELIFTINEAKGLEFDTVLLWKFASEARTADVWKTVLSESDKDIHQAQIRHE